MRLWLLCALVLVALVVLAESQRGRGKGKGKGRGLQGRGGRGGKDGKAGALGKRDRAGKKGQAGKPGRRGGKGKGRGRKGKKDRKDRPGRKGGKGRRGRRGGKGRRGRKPRSECRIEGKKIAVGKTFNGKRFGYSCKKRGRKVRPVKTGCILPSGKLLALGKKANEGGAEFKCKRIKKGGDLKLEKLKGGVKITEEVRPATEAADPACRVALCPKPDLSKPECHCSGDPHCYTFDGKKDDYQSTCRRLIVSPKGDYHTPFEVTMKTRYRSSKESKWGTNKIGGIRVSFIKTARLSIYGQKIDLNEGGGLVVNDKEVSAPFFYPPMAEDICETAPNFGGCKIVVVKQGSKGLLATAKVGSGVVTLQYDGNHKMKVHVPADMKSNTAGMCGYFDGNKNNDWRMPNDTLAKNYNKFGATWLTFDEEDADCNPMADEPPFDCSGDKKAAAEAACAIIQDKAGAFTDCFAQGGDMEDFAKQAYDDCVFDVCSLPPDAEPHCQQIEAFATRCQAVLDKAGGDAPVLSWRGDVCKPKCDEGMEWDDCGPSTPPSCNNPEPVGTKECVAGCYCKEGTILSKGKCVPEDECGCVDEDLVYRQVGESWLQGDCTGECTCAKGGAIECKAFVCEAPFTCRAKKGKAACTCGKGTRPNKDDKSKCDEIDECKEKPKICGPNSVCEDKPAAEGRYECGCKEGFVARKKGRGCRKLKCKKADRPKADKARGCRVKRDGKDEVGCPKFKRVCDKPCGKGFFRDEGVKEGECKKCEKAEKPKDVPDGCRFVKKGKAGCKVWERECAKPCSKGFGRRPEDDGKIPCEKCAEAEKPEPKEGCRVVERKKDNGCVVFKQKCSKPCEKGTFRPDKAKPDSKCKPCKGRKVKKVPKGCRKEVTTNRNGCEKEKLVCDEDCAQFNEGDVAFFRPGPGKACRKCPKLRNIPKKNVKRGCEVETIEDDRGCKKNKKVCDKDCGEGWFRKEEGKPCRKCPKKPKGGAGKGCRWQRKEGEGKFGCDAWEKDCDLPPCKKGQFHAGEGECKDCPKKRGPPKRPGCSKVFAANKETGCQEFESFQCDEECPEGMGREKEGEECKPCGPPPKPNADPNTGFTELRKVENGDACPTYEPVYDGPCGDGFQREQEGEPCKKVECEPLEDVNEEHPDPDCKYVKRKDAAGCAFRDEKCKDPEPDPDVPVDGGCPDGFKAEGETCVDVDECKEEKNPCKDRNAVCKNIEGSFECDCKDNFFRPKAGKKCKKCKAGKKPKKEAGNGCEWVEEVKANGCKSFVRECDGPCEGDDFVRTKQGKPCRKCKPRPKKALRPGCAFDPDSKRPNGCPGNRQICDGDCPAGMFRRAQGKPCRKCAKKPPKKDLPALPKGCKYRRRKGRNGCPKWVEQCGKKCPKGQFRNKPKGKCRDCPQRKTPQVKPGCVLKDRTGKNGCPFKRRVCNRKCPKGMFRPKRGKPCKDCPEPKKPKRKPAPGCRFKAVKNKRGCSRFRQVCDRKCPKNMSRDGPGKRCRRCPKFKPGKAPKGCRWERTRDKRGCKNPPELVCDDEPKCKLGEEFQNAKGECKPCPKDEAVIDPAPGCTVLSVPIQDKPGCTAPKLDCTHDCPEGMARPGEDGPCEPCPLAAMVEPELGCRIEDAPMENGCPGFEVICDLPCPPDTERDGAEGPCRPCLLPPMAPPPPLCDYLDVSEEGECPRFELECLIETDPVDPDVVCPPGQAPLAGGGKECVDVDENPCDCAESELCVADACVCKPGFVRMPEGNCVESEALCTCPVA